MTRRMLTIARWYAGCDLAGADFQPSFEELHESWEPYDRGPEYTSWLAFRTRYAAWYRA